VAANQDYEVCVVGAGIAGLNALVVATGYLGRTDRVVLVDSRPAAGGMWVDTYDYVRLHQPHGIFTAGDIKWTLGQDPSYLATKAEVLQHLRHCLAIARGKVDLDERFGSELISHREETDGWVVVTLRGPDGQESELRTRRLIKAFGHGVRPNEPLTLSSQAVRSITPESPEAEEALLRDRAPVWVVGGGKTAMDTAHTVITSNPGREVNVLAGPGTIFSRREAFFPRGAKRWWSGTRINAAMRESALRFDGTNEGEVAGWYLERFGTSPVEAPAAFFGAYLSELESATIRGGSRSIEKEYLDDVVDTPSGPAVRYRSAREVPVTPGSWVVNCTGSLLRHEHPYEPFASESGRVLSVQMRSSTTGVFSSFAGYFLPHLMFRDDLRGSGLYELDVEQLHSKNKSIVIYASITVALHNLGVLATRLPPSVLLGCGLDYDRWFPLPRRLYAAGLTLATSRSDRRRYQETLATLGDRYDVRAGLLP